MHGIVFFQLRKYVETKHGRRAWNTLLKHAKLENRAYLSVSEYPDAEMEALVSAAGYDVRPTRSSCTRRFRRIHRSAIDEHVRALDSRGVEDSRCDRKDRGNHRASYFINLMTKGSFPQLC